MPMPRPRYPKEFKAEAVQLVKRGEKPMTQIARDLGVSVESLRQWVNERS